MLAPFFICAYLGIHSCFACKKQDKEVRRCSVSQCGKFYHEECVKKLPQARMEGKGFICPLHVCATCAADNIRNPKAVKGINVVLTLFY